MGDFSPRGCNSSSLVLDSSTKTVVTPCSGRSYFDKIELNNLERRYFYLRLANGSPEHVPVEGGGSLQVGHSDGDMIEFTETPDTGWG